MRPRLSRLCAMAALAGAAAGSLAAPALAPASTHTVPDTLAQRLQACTACHGKEGRATQQGYFPRIAGKPAGYLYQQLLNFREGRRSNPAMSVWVEQLSDTYLREIAEHFAALSLPYPPPQAAPTTAAAQAHGERLVLRGDPSRQLPACVQCHGAAMAGRPPAMPGLLGLPRDYLVGQLGAWQAGQRRATAPDCMAQIARRLSPDDIAAVAGWLAAQPVVAALAPPAAQTPPMPSAPSTPTPRCGSGLP